MVTQLRVVNDCLAIMGEAPLNSLQEDHDFKTAALNGLSSLRTRILARGGQGWWFNEEIVKLSVNPLDNRIYLPGDALSVVILDERPRLAQRGRILYKLEEATDQFDPTDTYQARIFRDLAIELIPTSVAEYIAGSTVLWFQNEYDGDQTKTRNLMQTVAELKADAGAEHIRNRKVNLLNSNVSLARIRNIVRQGRRY